MSFIKRIGSILGFTRENQVLWGVCIGHGFTHWLPSTFYLLLPFIKDELGLSYMEMGLLVSFRSIGSMVAGIPSGMIADLIGKHYLILTVALSWVGIPYFFVGISSNYTFVLLCMLLMGMGNNLWHPAAMSMLRDAYPQKAGRSMGWHYSAAHAGDALGPLMSGTLLAWFTWRYILKGSSIPGFGMALLIWWLLRTPQSKSLRLPEKDGSGNQTMKKQRPTVGEYFKGLGRLLIDPNILLLSLISGVRSFTQSGLHSFLPSFFMHLLHFSPWLSGAFMTIVQVTGIIAGPISGSISDRHGPRRVVTAALFSTSLAIFLLAFLNVPWLFVVFLGVMGFFLYSLTPVLIAWIMEVAPKKLEGSVVGLQFSLQAAFGALAPALGGWIADQWGLMYTFYFLAAVLLLSNLLVVFLKEPVRGKTRTRQENGER
jgi:MFS family permease